MVPKWYMTQEIMQNKFLSLHNPGNQINAENVALVSPDNYECCVHKMYRNPI